MGKRKMPSPHLLTHTAGGHLAPRSSEWKSLLYPSPVSVLKNAAPKSYLGSTVELTLNIRFTIEPVLVWES